MLLVGVESKNSEAEVVLYNQATLFLMGQGGWGGDRSSSRVIKTQDVPDKDPDLITEFR